MRLFKRIALALAVLLVVLAGFFAWASSGTLAEEDLAVVTAYAAPLAPPRDTFTVMTYNLGYLSGMTNNRAVRTDAALFEANMEAAAALIGRAGADLVAFQEIDFGAARSFEVHQLDTLAARGGFAASAAAVNWDERYVPFPSMNPRYHFGRVLSGQAVLSRFPIRGQERVVLARPAQVMSYPPPLNRLAGAFYIDRLAQVVEVDLGRPLALVNVHFEAWDVPARQRQAAQVRALYRRLAAAQPVLLVGDFNSLLPAARQSRLLPPERRAYFAEDRTLDVLLQGTGLRQAFPDSLYRADEAATFTSPADAPVIQIDHLFYDPSHFEVIDAYVVGGPLQPSDHRAVVVRFAFKR